MPDWLAAPDYTTARWVVEHGIAALVYLVAFVVAAHQFRALLGERGMLPVPALPAPASRSGARRACSTCTTRTVLRGGRRGSASRWSSARCSRAAADALPLWPRWRVGAAVGALPVDRQRRPGLVLVRLGVAAARGGLPRDLPRQRRRRSARPRCCGCCAGCCSGVEFGAGLIKMRGDPCWRDLTCLYYHHETQPMPGPLSWYFHQLPRPAAQGGGGRQPRRPTGRAVRGCSSRSRSPASRPRVMIVTQLWLVRQRQLRLAELDDHRAGALGAAGRVLGRGAARRRRSPRRRPVWFDGRWCCRRPPWSSCSATGRPATCSSRRPAMNASLRPVASGQHLRRVRQRSPGAATRWSSRARRTRPGPRRPSGGSTSSRASRATCGGGRASSRRTTCGWTG